MTYRFFVNSGIFYAMETSKNGIAYYVGNIYNNRRKEVTEEHFMRALAYSIDVHDGYVMVIG